MWNYYKKKPLLITSEVWGDFFRRILKKRSFLIIIVGDQGKGKSWAVASTCEAINSEFSEKDVIKRLKLVKVRMREVQEQGKKFWVLNLDDFGRQLDPNRFNSAAALAMSWIFQTYRTLHQGVFLTVPNKELINKTFRQRLPNFRMEVLGHNSSMGYTKCKFHRIQVNMQTGKVYNHNIFYSPSRNKLSLIRGKDGVAVVEFFLDKPSDKFLDWYIPFRDSIAVDNIGEEKEELEDLEEFQEELDKSAAKVELLKEAKEAQRLDKEKERQDKLEANKQRVRELGDKAVKVWRGKKVIDYRIVSGVLGISRNEADLIIGCLSSEGYPKQ